VEFVLCLTAESVAINRLERRHFESMALYRRGEHDCSETTVPPEPGARLSGSRLARFAEAIVQ
jgi:hypothetical protein